MKREVVKRQLIRHELTFSVVMGRLKAALGVESDTELAQMLGMSTSNYANRKRGESIPFDMVLPLAISRNVSIDWLCTGAGSTFMDGESVDGIRYSQVDIALLQSVAHALESAFAANTPDRLKTVRAATLMGGLLAVIYNKVTAETDPAVRARRIQEHAEAIVESLKLQEPPDSVEPRG